jgi:hypothetical protein
MFVMCENCTGDNIAVHHLEAARAASLNGHTPALKVGCISKFLLSLAFQSTAGYFVVVGQLSRQQTL